MSNSSARSFLAAFAATGALASAAALVLTALVDPTGFAGLLWPDKPQLCAAGLRGGAISRAAIAARIRPDQVMTGNSRVQAGFATEDVRTLLQGRPANIGIQGAVWEDLDLLVRRAVREASPRRVWIGVDFGMFFSTQIPRSDVVAVDRALDGGWSGRAALFRRGVANGEEIETAFATLLNRDRCAHPDADTAGFAHPTAAEVYGLTRGPARFEEAAAVQRDVHKWLALADRRGVDRSYANRVAMFERLVHDLRRQRIEVIVFAGPVHPRLRQIIAQHGLTPPYARWRRDMDQVAMRAGLEIVRLPERQVHRVGEPAACARESRPPACPFYDPTHYRPWVGRLILERALEKGGSRGR